MNTAFAKSKYARVSPRKARLAADIIRGLPVDQALFQLTHCQQKGGRFLTETLNSAIANGESQKEMRRENMIVAEVRVDEGSRLKRAKPKNKGGRHPITKRTSHFTVVVSER